MPLTLETAIGYVKKSSLPLNSDNILEFISRVGPQWLAGFFDGEGHVSILKTSQDYYGLQLGVTQKDPALLVLILLRYSVGNIHIHRGANEIDGYAYRVHGEETRKIIEDILPFCIVKKERLEKALEFLSLPMGRGEEKERVRQDMLRLNSQGKSLARIASWQKRS